MIIGIDPGLTGAICFLDSTGAIVELQDMPVMPVRYKNKTRNEINGSVLYGLLAEAASGSTVVLEHVTSSPQMGATSAFRFGEGYGVVQGVIAATGYRLVLVRPAKWKREMGLGKDKSAARSVATRLWPSAAEMFKRKKDDGRAEAALLAEWYRTRS